jgi:hypothetical protein
MVWNFRASAYRSCQFDLLLLFKSIFALKNCNTSHVMKTFILIRLASPSYLLIRVFIYFVSSISFFLPYSSPTFFLRYLLIPEVPLSSFYFIYFYSLYTTSWYGFYWLGIRSTAVFCKVIGSQENAITFRQLIKFSAIYPESWSRLMINFNVI